MMMRLAMADITLGALPSAEEGLVLVPDHVAPVQVLHRPVTADVGERVHCGGVAGRKAGEV
jgi:hypothetical protein